MIAKCNCNQCSTHLEFDSANAGQVINCPTCGMETTLYVPPPPAPKSATPISNPQEHQFPPAESLKQIRHQTCYQTLRSLINILQIFCFIFAGLIALGALASIFDYSQIKTAVKTADGEATMAMMVFGGRILLGLAGAIVFVFLAIAGKQSALLLVDIADCQIRLAGKAR
jgi:DNA-directed RNA polymerase subunit RPC12/RpoP